MTQSNRARSFARAAGPRGLLRRLLRSQGGSVAVYVGLTLPLFIGAAGLAVDITSWYQTKRTTQSGADAAAYAAALRLAQGGLDDPADQATLEKAANDAAARNGVSGSVVVTKPPDSGPATGDDQSVQVVVNEPASIFFTSLFLDGGSKIEARAVAKAVVSDACIWSLHPSKRGAFSIAGSAQVELGCGVVVNSDHIEAALEQTGSSCLTATSVSVRGGYAGTCVSPDPEVFTPDYGDPLSYLQPPPYGTCDHVSTVIDSSYANQYGVGGVVTLSPGVYCDGIQIKANQTVVFDPGLYVLNRGEFYIAGNAHVSNDEDSSGGVTFYLTGTGTDYAYLTFESGADITLTPMTTGDLANVLFYQDPNAPSTGTNKVAGGASMHITGIVYIPNQHVEFTGGSATQGANVVIASSTMTFTGNTHLNADYAKNLLPDTYYVRLVE